MTDKWKRMEQELEQLKGLLDRLWRSMETHRMQHDSGEEKNEIQ